MSNSNQHGSDPEMERKNLILDADNQFPGVMDLLRVYGDYEEALLLLQEYRETTEPPPLLVSSNQSSSTY